MTAQALGEILQHPAIWRARDGHGAGRHGHGSHGHEDKTRIPTGHPRLDAVLPGGGWPRAGLTELLCDQAGIGELQLLAPALARLSREDERWIVWINPPRIPYAPALAQSGIRLDRVLWVRTRDRQETLWAAHQALESGTACAVLAWLDGDLPAGASRRLQVAAADHDGFGVLFRPQQARKQASGAMLRIGLAAARDGLEAEVIKRRGDWPAPPVILEPHPHWQQRSQSARPAARRRNRGTTRLMAEFTTPRPHHTVPA